MNADQKINSLLIRFQGLVRQCRAELEAGGDDAEIRARMAEVKAELERIEEEQRVKKVLQ